MFVCFAIELLDPRSCAYYFLPLIPLVPAYVIVTLFNLIIQNRYGISFGDTPITCSLVRYIIGKPSLLLYALMLICASTD